MESISRLSTKEPGNAWRRAMMDAVPVRRAEIRRKIAKRVNGSCIISQKVLLIVFRPPPNVVCRLFTIV
jgi:hypothetical protein